MQKDFVIRINLGDDMSKMPIDIVSFSRQFEFEINNAVTIANDIQNEFLFTKVSPEICRKFHFIDFDKIYSVDFFTKAIEIKNNLKGFFPYLVFFSDSPLESDDYSNLYSVHRAEDGVSVITTDNVPSDDIIPKDKMVSYFVYYLARIVLKFILNDKYNHEFPSVKGCLFDFMKDKKDLLKSMRPNAICDECRREILNSEKTISEDQLHAIDILLSKSGTLLKEDDETGDRKRKIFIGSSVEGLNVARKIKSSLKYDAHVDTWADGLFDRPGSTYIEVLEDIIDKYEYGVFVFTPDDSVFSRGKIQSIPRDNVIFEYGMFLGKHTRNKAFFIIPRGVDIKLMTDVLGIISLEYDPTNANLDSAVGDACDRIREIITDNDKS